MAKVKVTKKAKRPVSVRAYNQSKGGIMEPKMYKDEEGELMVTGKPPDPSIWEELGNAERCCYVEGELRLVGQEYDEPDQGSSGYVTPEGNVYDPNFLGNYESSDVLDVRATNILAKLLGNSPFDEWDFNQYCCSSWEQSGWKLYVTGGENDD
jgi:hypothetical protein